METEEDIPLTTALKDDHSSQLTSLLQNLNFKVTMLITFLFSYIYSFSSILLSIFYITIWDLEDETAGILISLLSLQALTVFLPGLLIQKIGIKLSYIITSLFSIFSFLLVVLVDNLILQICLLTLIFCLTPTVFFPCTSTSTVADTNFTNRSMGFSILNATYCLATLVLSLTCELVFYLKGINKSSFVLIFLSLIACFCLILAVASMWYEEPAKVRSAEPGIGLTEVLNHKRYWKTFLALFICAIPIACSFAPGTVLPIYLERELNTSAYYGFFFGAYYTLLGVFSVGLNSFICCLSSYDAMILGGFITALAPLFFVIDNSYLIISFYIVTVAAGGAIIQSRYLEYNSSAAIKGLEGYFYGILVFSYSAAHFIIGILAGVTLKEFCPGHGERQCWLMWVVFAGVSAFGSVLMWVLKPYLHISFDEQDLDPYVFSSDLK